MNYICARLHYVFIYLIGTEVTDKELPFVRECSKFLQWQWQWQWMSSQRWEPGIRFKSLAWVTGSQSLETLQLLPRVYIRKKLDSNLESEVKPRHSSVELCFTLASQP